MQQSLNSQAHKPEIQAANFLSFNQTHHSYSKIPQEHIPVGQQQKGLKEMSGPNFYEEKKPQKNIN